jgi:hypothetical protein
MMERLAEMSLDQDRDDEIVCRDRNLGPPDIAEQTGDLPVGPAQSHANPSRSLEYMNTVSCLIPCHQHVRGRLATIYPQERKLEDTLNQRCNIGNGIYTYICNC